ncbi:protein IRON-RELATED TRANSCRIPTION FACTOR 2-like [Zingiber officinale]|uniref:protein IRON-RELATED TRANSCRIPTION FACTOR 2-like n=1 Tax=Zingiber officinale TaxID=94328 RepID=UPI001C4C87FD|nr:protein IRON-RELATED TRANSCRIPTION FACTOR 2-like [Zingiber officinale]
MAAAGFADFTCSQLEPEAEVDGALEQIDLDDESFLQHYYSMLGGQLESPSSTRKLGHNAYERDRRKKTNDLYSSLRNLLPESKQNKEKKVSIPMTISQVLKYIPELKAELQQLSRRKEEMLLVLRRREEETHRVQSVGYPLISVSCLSNREIMVQLCLLSQDAMISLAGILSALDGEGLQLLNASTHTAEDGRCFCSLHLQAREAFKTDIFGDHLIRQIKLQEARAEYSGVAPAFMHM